MKPFALAGAVVAAALAFAPAGARPAAHGGARTLTVTIDQLAFGPLPATLHVGDRILWVNRDLFRHSATDHGHFDVDLPPGARRTMLMTSAGVFPFLCKYHPGMKGVLKVSQ